MQAVERNDRVMYLGTGRRKSSVARVRLVPGNGQMTINGKPGDYIFNSIPVTCLWLKHRWKRWDWKLSMTFWSMSEVAA
jgi:hypothetical protein